MIGIAKLIKLNQVTGVRSLHSSRFSLANYGFIGLGQMGQHMARHVYNSLAKDEKLYVNDTLEAATANFLKSVKEQNPGNADKIKELNSIESFVTQVEQPLDFIITMVPEGRHVQCIVEKLTETYKKHPQERPTTFLDSSTIDIITSIKIHEYVKRELPDYDFIDTPVSGGVSGARNATLCFMLSRENDESISPELFRLLKVMGKNIFPCGENHGTGLAAKLSNNYLLAVTNLAVADSFQLANSFGLDLKKYANLVSVSTGKCWAAVDNCPIPHAYPKEKQLVADNGYAGGFVTKLTRKDLVLATESAKSRDRYLFLGDVSRKLYDKACERDDLANRDLGVLFEWLGEIDENPANK